MFTRLPLLLVVDGGVGEFFALGVCPGDGNGAALAIGRDNQSAGHGDFAGFLHGHLQVVIVDFPVGAHVLRGVAGDGIIFVVELAGPLVVGGLTIRVDSVDCDFDAVTGRRVDDGLVLGRAWGDLRFALVQLPGAHLRAGVTGGSRGEAESQGQ